MKNKYIWAVLNNYQMGSEAYNCMLDMIIQVVRLDTWHTLVIWDGNKITDSNKRQLNFHIFRLHELEYESTDLTEVTSYIISLINPDFKDKWLLDKNKGEKYE